MKIPKHMTHAEVGHEQQPISDGHDSERIWHNDRYIEYYRYVIADFLGVDPDDLPKDLAVHHIDGDRSNNNIDNLLFGTRKAHERLETFVDPKKYCKKD